MSKKLWLFAFILLLPRVAVSQYKIHLSRANLFNYNGNYLLNVPLQNETHNLFLIDDAGLMAAELPGQPIRLSLMQSIDTLFIARKTTRHTKPVRQKNTGHYNMDTYIIANPNHNNKADTVNGINNSINNYHELDTPLKTQTEDSVLVYYAEGYGSSCCPRDPKWDRPDNLKEFIENFEKANNAKIGLTYSVANGDEGEHATYFSLSGLNGEQKTAFITERLYDLIPDKETKDIKLIPVMYAPFWIQNPDVMRLPLQQRPKGIIYTYTDEMPSFPAGNRDFSMYLIKNIHPKQEVSASIVVSFVVTTTGALINPKIIRSYNDDLNKELIRVIKKSPRWNPGKIAGTAVNVQYSVRVYIN